MASRQPAMRALTTDGLQFPVGLTAADASLVGTHWNAVRLFVETGDDRALQALGPARLSNGMALETRLDVIEREALRGQVQFEDIYSDVIPGGA